MRIQSGRTTGDPAYLAHVGPDRDWFRLWLPLGKATPSRDTYLRRVQPLDPETAVKTALWLLDGTRLPGLRELVLALDGKVARCSGDRAAGTRALHLVREGLTLAQEPCGAKSNEIAALPRLLDRLVLAGAFAPEAEDRCKTVERNGGRRKQRTCTVLGDPGFCEWVADPEAWPGLAQSNPGAGRSAPDPAVADNARCATTSRADRWLRRPYRPRPRSLGC